MFDNLRRSLFPNTAAPPGRRVDGTAGVAAGLDGARGPGPRATADHRHPAGLLGVVQQAWRHHTHQALASSPGRAEYTPWQMPFRQLYNGALRALLFLAFLPMKPS